MASIAIDRTDGLSSATAIKGPVRVATTANIALTGLQTVDGVSLAVGDRVLVKDQTTASENGIYVVDTGPWRRAKDFSGNRDVRKGTQILVTGGTLYASSGWYVSSADPVVIGTTAIQFTQNVLLNAAQLIALEAAASASADAASNSADAAAADLTSMLGIFLGAYASDAAAEAAHPGRASGSRYFNTTDGRDRVWTGAAWTYAGNGDMVASANLSDVDDATLSAGNLKLIERDTVALLLADTILAYAPGAGKTEVVAGQIVKAGGFRYQVAASGASDHHLTTAGGVKLYVMASSDGKAHVAAVGTGLTDYASVINALFDVAQVVVLPAGAFRHTATIVVPDYKTMEGQGHGVAVSGTAPTILLKDGDFTGITVGQGSTLSDLSSEGAAGNGGDGIQQIGARSVMRNVSAFNHARDGIKIGGYTGQVYNTNVWRAFNLVSRVNGRRGVYISHDGKTTLPDVNAGLLMGLDAGGNGEDGLTVGEAVDNQLLGVVVQSNAGWGVRFLQYAKGNYLPCAYTEANTTGQLRTEVGADRNFIVGVSSGGSTIVVSNAGADNMIVDRNGSFSGIPRHAAPEIFTKLLVMEDTTSGLWNAYKEATTRHLRLDLTGTSAGGDVLITSTGGGAAGLRFGTAARDLPIRWTRGMRPIALDHGTIGAGAVAEVSISFLATDITAACHLVCNPAFDIPAGIMWSSYWKASTSRIVVRCHNTTGAGVAVSGNWFILAIGSN